LAIPGKGLVNTKPRLAYQRVSTIVATIFTAGAMLLWIRIKRDSGSPLQPAVNREACVVADQNCGQSHNWRQPRTSLIVTLAYLFK
jgi:hypothetical protein